MFQFIPLQSFTAVGRIVGMTNKTELSLKNIYSTSMKGEVMTLDSYYDTITQNQSAATELYEYAQVGFYKVGQLLNKAKKELGGDFGKLKKRLTEEHGLHEKAQERYMRIARNPNIELNYSKMPKEWTFWEQLSKLEPHEFKAVEHMINKDAKWKELALVLKKPVQTTTTLSHHQNQNDNRTEVFGLEYNPILGTKKHQSAFDDFDKDVKALAKKYPFIKLKKKNYYDEVVDILNNDIVDDDTSKKDTKKFKKQYKASKKIDV